MLRYGSVCSGIEAASVAWHPLGWKAAWLAEIEPFPSAVLAHHYPDVPNLGDMTKLARGVLLEQVEAPDILVGGTPCQAFSVAGMRAGLADPRGALTIKFVELADAIDHVRAARGEESAIVVWENVPGVLSDKGNAFGCFLGALVGESDALQPSGGKWTDAGCVYGPRRSAAWRVLDAQYFGLAQRRRRVFVVASARKGFDPAAVLFEWDGVRRDSAPSREARKGIARSTETGAVLRCGCGYEFSERLGAYGCPNCEGDEGPASQVASGTICVATGQAGAEIGADMAPTLNCNHEAPYVAHSLRGEGFDASEDGTGRGTPLVPVADTLYNKGIVTLKEGNASTQETYPGTLLRTLRQEVGEEAFAKWGLGILDSLQQAEVLRQALHGLSIRPAAFSRSWVVYCALSRSESRSGWLLQSLREAGCERCASQGWEPSEQLDGELGAYLSELSQPGAQASRFMRDLWWAAQGPGLLREALSAVQEVGRPAHGKRKPVHAGAEGFGAAGAEGLQGAGLHREIPRDGVLQQACAASEAGDSGCSATEQERGGQSRLGQTPFAVRRLTCEEAEFLQGFPRGYTLIPWRKKPASECPDGPRYRALGNSWAIPCVSWIGERIQRHLAGEL